MSERKRSSVPPLGSWAPRERRYIVEWANERFPEAEKMFNVPLGPVPESLIAELGSLEKAARTFRSWRPKIDAVLKLPDKVIFAEAEILDPKNAIGDLLYYRELVPETPDLGEILNMKREFWLVIPTYLKWVEDFATKRGIVVDIYTPDWLEDYLEEWKKYTTPEGMLKRQARKRMFGRI